MAARHSMPRTRRLSPRSHSQLEQMDECPLAYKFRYIDKVPFKKGEALNFGSGFHEWRARYYEHCRAEGVESDWDSVKAIARSVFNEKSLPHHRWDEFHDLCLEYARNRIFNGKMQIEVKFGVDRTMRMAEFDDANFFRGIIDGLEIDGDVGTITDAKTSRSTKLPFTQLKIYAAFMALQYPQVKEWRLFYDFVRMNHLATETVLTENLQEIRTHVRLKVEKVDSQTDWPATPSEACLTCPFLSRCDYRIKGLKIIRTDSDAKAVMEDYAYLKAKTAQAKRLVKAYVEDNVDIETDTLRAGVFSRESISCDKRLLIKILKTLKQDPVNFVEFPPKVLKKLRYNREISEEVGNAIFVESKHRFDIRKRGKQEDEEEEGDDQG